jgi:TolB-like protein
MTPGLVVTVISAAVAVIPTLFNDRDQAGSGLTANEPTVRNVRVDDAALASAQGELAKRVRIAVVPIVTTKGDPSQARAALGCTMALTADLRYVPGMLVVDRAEVLRSMREFPSPAEIGRSLGVRYVVTGNLTREGFDDQLAIEAIELPVPPAIEGQVRARASARRPSGRVDELVGVVLLDLLGQLHAEIPPDRAAEITRVRTLSDSARILCDDGLAILDRNDGLHRGTEPLLFRRALNASQAALKADPRYVRAMLLQASCLLRLGDTTSMELCLTEAYNLRVPDDRSDGLTRLEADADHAALVKHDLAAAVSLYQKILDIDPGHLHALWMLTAIHAGEYPPSNWPGYSLEKATDYAARLIVAHPESAAARLLSQRKP